MCIIWSEFSAGWYGGKRQAIVLLQHTKYVYTTNLGVCLRLDRLASRALQLK